MMHVHRSRPYPFSDSLRYAVAMFLGSVALLQAAPSPSPSPSPSATPLPAPAPVNAPALMLMTPAPIAGGALSPVRSFAPVSSGVAANVPNAASVLVARSFAAGSIVIPCHLSSHTPAKNSIKGGYAVEAATTVEIKDAAGTTLPAGSKISGIALTTPAKTLEAFGFWQAQPKASKASSGPTLSFQTIVFRADPTKLDPAQRAKIVNVPLDSMKPGLSVFVVFQPLAVLPTVAISPSSSTR